MLITSRLQLSALFSFGFGSSGHWNLCTSLRSRACLACLPVVLLNHSIMLAFRADHRPILQRYTRLTGLAAGRPGTSSSFFSFPLFSIFSSSSSRIESIPLPAFFDRLSLVSHGALISAIRHPPLSHWLYPFSTIALSPPLLHFTIRLGQNGTSLLTLCHSRLSLTCQSRHIDSCALV